LSNDVGSPESIASTLSAGCPAALPARSFDYFAESSANLVASAQDGAILISSGATAARVGGKCSRLHRVRRRRAARRDPFGNLGRDRLPAPWKGKDALELPRHFTRDRCSPATTGAGYAIAAAQ